MKLDSLFLSTCFRFSRIREDHRLLLMGFGILLCLQIPGQAAAQVYKSEGKNRYTFAQTTFGYDLEYTPPIGHSYFRDNNNQLTRTRIGNSFSPTISITGLHFWGHAEFFTSFSLPDIDLSGDTAHGDYKRFGATGFKIFPWPIRMNKLRPYLGMALSSFSYEQGDGVSYKHADGSILAGLTYSFRKGLLELGANYHYANRYRYYISKTEAVDMAIPAFSFSADYKYFFDLSVNSLRREQRGELKAEYEMLKKRKKLNSVSLALGPAYSFILGRSSYNLNHKPYLHDHQVTALFPDIGLGYYHYRYDAAVNLSLRFFRSNLYAYENDQKVKRTSIALELYKFLGDYHGFVPFVGGMISREDIRVQEFEKGIETYRNSRQFLSPGIIAGWDIRPTRTDWWGVRTNIRYFPWLNLKMPAGGQINLQQIELNLLQMVLYPGRRRGALTT